MSGQLLEGLVPQPNEVMPTYDLQPGAIGPLVGDAVDALTGEAPADLVERYRAQQQQRLTLEQAIGAKFE